MFVRLKKKEKKSVGERSQPPCEIKQRQKKGDGEDFEIRVRRMWLCANEEKMARGVQDLLEKFQGKKKGLSPRLHAKLMLVQTAVRTSKPTQYQVKMSFCT